jgi:UDP:flavonoid glycosyltransferase YjiC (YdhE family)
MVRLSQRLRILFIGEGATLAHAARPLALAAALPQDRFEAIVATPERYGRWAADHVRLIPLEAQSPETFLDRISRGRPMFSHPRLESYVAHDLELLAGTKPDVVVGDLRLSLAASARKAKAPYISISNAYWSPDRPLKPVRPALRPFEGLPAPVAEAAFRAVWPAAHRWHAKPVDQLTTSHGLGGIGRDLRRALTEADVTLFADLPALFPEIAETPHRRFIGPPPWEPPVDPPTWWNSIPERELVAYLTLGSSGDADTLKHAAAWLVEAGYVVIVATAGRVELEGDGERLFTSDYLPGSAAARRSAVVVCNGGSPTVSQALAAGRPIIGLCANMDQFLNMGAVEAQGAGVMLRADRLDRRRFIDALERTRRGEVKAAAERMAAQAASLDPVGVLIEAIQSLAG